MDVKNRAALALIEQSVMLLVFALAAVLCLRGFLWADETAADLAARDQALLLAQNTAEVLKASGGDLEQTAARCGGIPHNGQLVILYDENWAVTDDMHTYTLRAAPEESGLDYLGQAVVQVQQNERTLALLEVCWQEVSGHG